MQVSRRRGEYRDRSLKHSSRVALRTRQPCMHSFRKLVFVLKREGGGRGVMPVVWVDIFLEGCAGRSSAGMLGRLSGGGDIFFLFISFRSSVLLIFPLLFSRNLQDRRSLRRVGPPLPDGAAVCANSPPPHWLSLGLPQVLVGQRHHWSDLRKASTRTLDAGVACGESAGEHAMGFDAIKENHQRQICTDWTQIDQWDDTRPATRCKPH